MVIVAAAGNPKDPIFADLTRPGLSVVVLPAVGANADRRPGASKIRQDYLNPVSEELA